MRKPEWGELNRGALAGVLTGSLGGMIALRLPIAIHYRDLVLLVNVPKLALISCLLSAAVGWFLGGQLGPLLREKFRSPKAELIGGVLGGLLLVLALMGVGWHFTPTD